MARQSEERVLPEDDRVMLGEPQPSPYDLRWRMFGIGVRVQWMFWLVALLLTWSLGRDYGAIYLPLGILCVFISILVHEMGHVLMGLVFGSRSHIVLHAFGGLAISNDRPRAHWKRILISLAGPVAQFILLGILIAALMIWWETAGAQKQNGAHTVFGGLYLDRDVPEGMVATIELLIFINMAWPILNLLPIWPLDGGQITRSVCEAISPTGGAVTSLTISLAVSGALAAAAAVNFFASRAGASPFKGIPILGGLGLFHLIFFAMFAYSSWQALQFERVTRKYQDEDDDDDYDDRGRR